MLLNKKRSKHATLKNNRGNKKFKKLNFSKRKKRKQINDIYSTSILRKRNNVNQIYERDLT